MIDLRNPTRSNGNNLLHLVNKYMDLYQANPNTLVYKAKAEKYAKIISKTIILSGIHPISADYFFLLYPSGPREIDGSQTTTKLHKEIWWQNYCAGAVTLLHVGYKRMIRKVKEYLGDKQIKKVTTADTPTNADGKREAHNIYAHTLEECEEKLQQMIEEVRAQIAVDKERKKHP